MSTPSPSPAPQQSMLAAKQKVQLLKSAILKERAQRQGIEQELKALSNRCMAVEQLLHKREEKNEALLHESRQLKDILIREKEQIREIEAEIAKIRRGRQQGSTSRGQQGQSRQAGQQGNDGGWKGYLTSLWK